MDEFDMDPVMGVPTGVERLQAAIEKLESLRAQAQPGPWVHEEDVVNGTELGTILTRDEYEGDRVIVSDWTRVGDGDLIVTLHRTIGAQLAILRNGLTWPSKHTPGGSLYLTLADAILGGA